MSLLRMAALLCIVLSGSGCSSFIFPGVYRIDVPQGNVVTQDMVDKLKPGMTQRQVRFVLGTPLIQHTFDENRWDYVYSTRKGDEIAERKKLSVFFADEKLSRYEWQSDAVNG